MKKSLVILASVLLLIGAGCEDRLKDATQPAAETQEADRDGRERAPVSGDAKSEENSGLDADGDASREREDEREDEKESDDDDDNGGTAPTPAPSSGASGSVKTYAMAEVAAHKDAASCWSAVNGSVYDLTPWIGKHPGGSATIKMICGLDGSKEFNAQHSGERRPEQALAIFKIGELKK